MMFIATFLAFLVSVSPVFSQLEFSLETIDAEGSGCYESPCILEINNKTDNIIEKIESIEQKNDEALKRITLENKELQEKMIEVNNKTDRLLAKIENMETKNNKSQRKMDEVNAENKHLQAELTSLQDELSKIREKMISHEACFEDMSEVKCTGSKIGKVGIIEAVRVDGSWSPWSPWSGCSATCGGGIQVRGRTCNNPSPVYGGKPCPGVQVEEKKCNGKVCCLDGWVGFGSHCYTLVEAKMTWTEAEEHCRTEFQANLVSIASQEEQEFVASLIKKGGTWIGGSDAEKEGTWVWSNGIPWGYTAWGKIEPNNHGGSENYLQIWKGRSSSHWNDNNDYHKNPSVCKLLSV